MGEGSKVFLDQGVHPFNENSVLRLEKFVTRVDPLLNRFFYEPFSHYEWIIVRELACLGPTFNMRG